MIPIKNFIKVEEIDDNNVKKELLFEDTIENPTWYTVEDNHISLVIERKNCITKFETDILDNYVFYSTIEIMKAVSDQNGVLSSLQKQETFDSLKTSDLVNSNNEDINHTKTFCCDICGICFAAYINLKDHMETHKKPPQIEFKCSFCDKKFKLNFSLNRHIKKYHLRGSRLNEYMKTNKNNCSEKKADVILNLKLCKLNGVWKSKTNYVYKCNICFEKFHNESNLIEHESIHKQHSDNDLKQCEFCLKFISVSEFNDHIQQSHNTNVFKCRKCKLRFVKKQHLKRHFIQCTKSSRNIWDKFRGKHKNNVKNTFVCTICGIGFNNLLLFKNHMVSGCKHYSCTCCRKTFNSKCSMAKHMNRKCVNPIENINKTSVNISDHQNMVDKDNSNLNLKENNVEEKSSTVDMDLMNSNESTVTGDLMMTDCSINIEKGKSLSTNATESINSDCVDTANSNESTVQTAKHDLMVNTSVNAKKEKSSLVNVTEIVNSDHIDVVNNNESIAQIVPHNLTMNNYSVNVKKEKDLFTETNNSVCVDTTNKIIIEQTSLPHNLNIKKEPEDLDSETILTSTSESPNAGNSSSIATNIICEKKQQTKVKLVCNICKNSSIDRDSFALHMSSHIECNMHECVVCNTDFPSVLLWKDHMIYHQQQVDLNLLEPQIIPNGIESHIPDINAESMESQIPFTNLENGNNNILSSNIKLESNNVNQTEQVFSCNICPKICNSKIALISHQTIHRTTEPYTCKYCNRKFSARGPCTNHEKTHSSNKNKLFLHNNKQKKRVPNETRLNMNLENIDINPISIQHRKIIRQKKILKRKQLVCHICNKRFKKRCYFTNHLLLLHKVNPQSFEQHNSSVVNNISDGESVKSQGVNLYQEHIKNRSSDSANTNVNNSLNNSIKNKTSNCFICSKQCSNPGALNNHMIIHSDNKPYSCQYCGRTFKMKGPYLVHERSLKCRIENQNIIRNHLIKKEQIESCNSSELINNGYDNKLNCTNITKKERLWYVCDVCDKKFSTPFHLITHRNSHSIVPYVCKICDKSYDFRCHWNRHLKHHYMKNKQLKNSRSNPKLGVGKLQTNSVQHKNKFKCTYCKKECISMSCWKKHLSLSKECRRHCKQSLPEFTSVQAKENRTKSMLYECHICKKVYSTTFNLKKHIQTIHKQFDGTNLGTSANVGLQKMELTTIETISQNPKVPKQKRNYYGPKRTYCPLCDKSYSNFANLRRHENMIHMVNKTLKCNICEHVFSHSYAYRRHMRNTHKQILPSNNIGNENNNTKQNIPFIRKNVAKYFCKMCKMNFANNAALQRHTKTHIINNYKCKDCGLEFETNDILGEHIMEKHKTKISFGKNKIYAENDIQNSSPQPSNNNSAKCTICFKVVNSQNYLSKHMRLHSGIKPFKCNKCNKAFTFKSNLKIHEKKC